MKKQKRVSKAQMISALKQLSLAKRAAEHAAFTGMITLMNYVLWKEFKFSANKLVEFNQKVCDYESASEMNYESLHDRLMNYAGFPIEFVEVTKDDVAKFGNKAIDSIQYRIAESDNEINRQSSKHLLIAFNSLIDMKISKKRICNIKDSMNNYIATMYSDDGKRVMDMHEELFHEAGVYVQMPNGDSTLQKYLMEEDCSREDASITEII